MVCYHRLPSSISSITSTAMNTVTTTPIRSRSAAQQMNTPNAIFILSIHHKVQNSIHLSGNIGSTNRISRMYIECKVLGKSKQTIQHSFDNEVHDTNSRIISTKIVIKANVFGNTNAGNDVTSLIGSPGNDPRRIGSIPQIINKEFHNISPISKWQSVYFCTDFYNGGRMRTFPKVCAWQ